MNKSDQEKALNKPDEISLKELILKIQELWRYLLSKWVTIVIVGIISGILGIGYAIVKKPVYTAQLSFALQDEKSGGGAGLSSALGLASQFGIDLGGNSAGGEFSGDNLLELMKSRSMVEETLLTTVLIDGKKETLAELYIEFNQLREKWMNKPELKAVYFPVNSDRSKFTLHQDSVLGVFYKTLIKRNLTVDKIDKKLSIITVSVKSTNELFSKDFVEVLEKVVSDFYIHTKTEKAAKNVNILQKQTDSVRIALNLALSGVASLIDASPNPNPLLQILRVPSQRRQVDATANTAIFGELVKNLELAKMSLLQATPLIQVIDKPVLPLDKEKFGKIMGFIVGGMIGVFLTVVMIFFKRVLNSIMADTPKDAVSKTEI